MHENVDISRELQETNLLFASVLLTQGRSGGGGGGKTDDKLSDISADILAKVGNGVLFYSYCCEFVFQFLLFMNDKLVIDRLYNIVICKLH